MSPMCYLTGREATPRTDGTRSAKFKDKTTSSKKEIIREVFISVVFKITKEIIMLMLWTEDGCFGC